MTTPIEQRRRLTLQEMADEVHPSRPPENLSATAAPARVEPSRSALPPWWSWWPS